jgi:hypothetical protein
VARGAALDARRIELGALSTALLRDPRRSHRRVVERLFGGCTCNARSRPASYCLRSEFSLNNAPIRAEIGVCIGSIVHHGSLERR